HTAHPDVLHQLFDAGRPGKFQASADAIVVAALSHRSRKIFVFRGLTTSTRSAKMEGYDYLWRLYVADTAPSIEEYLAGNVVQYLPQPTGTTTPRKRQAHLVAVINECCTGCAASPACVEYCPVSDCMF